MGLLKEFYLLVLFTLSLLVVSSLFTASRTQDAIYLHADISVQENSLKQTSFEDKFFSSLVSSFKGDLGTTQSGEKVSIHILKRLLPTLQLALFSIVLGGGFAIFLSVFLIYKKLKCLESLFQNLSIIILSTPIFIVAILLFLVFFLYIPLLPPGGYEPLDPRYLILPGMALGSRVFSRIFLFALAEFKNEQNSAFVRFLYARGISRKKVYFKYILLKTIPLISVLLLLDLSSLLSGAMIVEEIFFFPGLGKSMYQGIKSMDENLLRGLLIYTGLIFYILTRIAKQIQSSLAGTET